MLCYQHIVSYNLFVLRAVKKSPRPLRGYDLAESRERLIIVACVSSIRSKSTQVKLKLKALKVVATTRALVRRDNIPLCHQSFAITFFQKSKLRIYALEGEPRRGDEKAEVTGWFPFPELVAKLFVSCLARESVHQNSRFRECGRFFEVGFHKGTTCSMACKSL